MKAYTVVFSTHGFNGTAIVVGENETEAEKFAFEKLSDLPNFDKSKRIYLEEIDMTKYSLVVLDDGY